MSKHTPGPWRIEQGALLTVEADSHLGPLAELRSRLDYSGMHPAVAATREANARLIASAPDLLEALRGMIKEFGFDVVHPQGLVHDEAHAIQRAMEVIAKATGND